MFTSEFVSLLSFCLPNGQLNYPKLTSENSEGRSYKTGGVFGLNLRIYLYLSHLKQRTMFSKCTKFPFSIIKQMLIMITPSDFNKTNI